MRGFPDRTPIPGESRAASPQCDPRCHMEEAAYPRRRITTTLQA